jgi:DNA-binding PadR family transcriptional regulator
VFEQGDLKYVILKLLAEKPRHGYEIIKELEDRFGGAYAPSAGTVYPTLSMLEDLGYARAVPEEGGRKVYEVTDAGRQYLADHHDVVHEIFERIRTLGDFLMGDAMLDVHRGVRRVATESYTQARRFQGDPAALGALAAALDAAARAIGELRPVPPPAAPPPGGSG